MTTTPNGLRAAALAVKDHAWLARFRKANYENKHHELSPGCANQIAGYVDDSHSLSHAEIRNRWCDEILAEAGIA